MIKAQAVGCARHGYSNTSERKMYYTKKKLVTAKPPRVQDPRFARAVSANQGSVTVVPWCYRTQNQSGIIDPGQQRWPKSEKDPLKLTSVCSYVLTKGAPPVTYCNAHLMPYADVCPAHILNAEKYPKVPANDVASKCGTALTFARTKHAHQTRRCKLKSNSL